VDDGAAGVFRDDTHAGAAPDVVAAHDDTRADQVDRGLARIGEVVVLYEQRYVAADNTQTLVGELVVTHADRRAAQVGLTADRPHGGISLGAEHVLHQHRVGAGGCEAHADPALGEAVALDSDVADV